MKKTVTKVDSKKISVVPLGDRVLIRPFSLDEVHTKTASGIIIPETIDKEKPRQGEVVAVGHGKMVDGKLVPLQVQVGDKVMFSYIYDELKIDGTEYYVIKEEGLLAIIK